MSVTDISINSVVLFGRLSKTPELYFTQKHEAYTLFQIANHYRNNVYFIDCIAWHGIAEFLVAYIGKGSLLGIEGILQNYTSKNCMYTQVSIKFLKVFIKKEDIELFLEKDINESIVLEYVSFDDYEI